MPSKTPFHLLPKEEIFELSFKNLKRYCIDVGMDVPLGTLKKGILRLVIKEAKFRDEQLAPSSPKVEATEADLMTLDEGEFDATEAGRKRRTVRFSGQTAPNGHHGQRKRGSSRRQTNYWSAVDVIASVQLFANWNRFQISDLVKELEDVEFEPGKDLMTYGEPGDEFYVIIDGICEVFSEGGDLLAECKAGDYVGELALLKKGAKRSATVRAKTEVVCLACDAKTFSKAIKTNVKFQKKLYKQRQAVVTRVKNLNLQDIQKVAKTESDIQALIKTMNNIEFFSNYNEDQLENVVDVMLSQTVQEGEEVIKQGDTKADKFYLVAKGSFDVQVDGESVATKVVSECFGEVALLYNQPRNATVVAAEPDCQLWTLDRQHFRAALTNVNSKANSNSVEFLKTNQYFANLTKQELNALDAAFEELTVSAGMDVIKEGDDPENMYVLQKGKVQWSKEDGESGELQPPTIFGERALLYDDVRAATITTLTDCQILELSKEDFSNLLGDLAEIIKRSKEELYQMNMEEQESMQEDCQSPHLFNKESLPALGELKELGVLGKGAYGLVTLVCDPSSDETFALKAIKKAKVVENGMEEYIQGEKNIMQKLDNKFLVNLKGTYMDPHRIYFLLEVCLGGELFGLLRTERSFSEDQARFYTGCVVEAFDYMHQRNIIYRDLKPENLVLDASGYLKVTDFGFAKQIDGPTYTFCGTPDYLAPEVITNQGHGKGVDWWTLGILLFEMLSSMPPFCDPDPTKTYKKIMKHHVKFPRFFSKHSKTLILGLLRKKQTRRLGVLKDGAQNIRDHKFFTEADGWTWEALQAGEIPPPYVPAIADHKDLKNFDEQYSDSESESESGVSIDEDDETKFFGF